ncbi:MAG TPA: AAA family ATPase [Dehalococcoidia bacterium]|nr:AAA family ATPase [Dehalococcoidia bacterium]
MPGPRRQAPFVGRQQELAALRACLAEAHAGRGGVTLLAGEPGIGKTRLLTELAGHARAAGTVVLTGHAYDGEGLPPYLPFIEALRGYVRACDPGAVPALPREGLAQLALLLPELHDRSPDLPAGRMESPELDRYRLFEAVADLLAAAARAAAGGLLLLLEDVHWADAASLALLQHVVRRLPELPLLLAASYRTVAPRPGQPLQGVLADLARQPNVERLHLRPLPPAATGELIAALIGTPAAAPVAGRVHAETEGNPFFVTEMIRNLQEEGIDLAAADAAAAGWAVPEGVRQVIGSRLARLGEAGNALLQAAAILGDVFPFDLLAAVRDATPAELAGALEDTVAAGLLREQPEPDRGYAFAHALIRQTVLAETALPRRQQLHLRAAETIERRYPEAAAQRAAELARHYHLAGRGADAGRTASYARLAAAAATRTFAWAAAAEQWQIVLELLPPEAIEQRARLLLALGEAQARAGALQASWETLQQAAELALAAELPEVVAEAALSRARYPGTGMVGHELLETALRLLPAHDSSLRVRLLSRVAQSLQTTISRQERRRALLDEALAMARRLGDPATMLAASLAWIVPQPSSPRWRTTVMELLELNEAAGERQWTALGFLWKQQLLVRLGDRVEARRALAFDQTQAEQLREPIYQYNVALVTAMWAMLEGHFSDAYGLLAEALALGERARQPLAWFWHDLQRAALLCDQEREAELLAQTEAELIARARRDPWASHWRARLAWLYARAGRLSDAHRELDGLAVNDFGEIPGPAGWNWLLCLALLPEVCVALGDTRRALPLYHYLETYAGHCIVIGPNTCICFGAADRYRGMLAALLGRKDDALAHYAAAVALNRGLGARVQLAHSLREYAVLLRAAGGEDASSGARAELEEALALYEALGLARAATATRALLAAEPGAARGRAAYPGGLSAREVEVLRLIASGSTNREIVGALTIAEGTVERHISNLYAKIGARNRAEATSYAHAHGLAALPPR